MTESDFSHFDPDGNARMVDIGEKSPTERNAIASAVVHMKSDTLEMIRSGGSKKGDVIGLARVAGIMGAKKTPDLIPLCHPIHVTRVELDFHFVSDREIRIEAAVDAHDRTGVEIEALTAASIAALTIYDMCKAVDREITIENIQLEKKTGGKSGTFERSPE